MLSSAIPFEPRLPLPPSSSHYRAHRTSRSKTSNSVNAMQASTSRLSASPPKQLPPIPSCIHPSSAFYQVLTAPYRPPTHPVVYQRRPVDPCHAEACNNCIDWSRSPSSEIQIGPQSARLNAIASAVQGCQIYAPHGRWAWADGLFIDDMEDLIPLESGKMCSAAIRRGTLGSRQITYISRCCKTSSQDRSHRFYSELALYKTERYLKSLQGDVLPWIIGVHVSPAAIDIAMEPPHHSFWIEASADMPYILKERCIVAFEKIHQRGVLHGNVELRHMLIGGDGKVTIINFQMSRALIPDADAMLLPAEPKELELEMRKVKYKLDYDGARKRETEKMMCVEGRDQNTREIDGSAAEVRHEGSLEEDVVDPPVGTQDWNENWANAAANTTPTRFIMPGQTSEALAKEVQTFLTTLDHMSTRTALTPTRSERRQVRFASEITSVAPADSAEFFRPLADNTPDSYGIRKRRLSESFPSSSSSHNPRFTKRSRSDRSLAPSISADEHKEEEEEEPIRPDKDRFTPPRTAPADVLETPESQPINPSPRFPPIKVRDFAYEPYDGPRGYYAPYPLMESVVSLNRRRWIRLQNEQRCTELGLPHPSLSGNITARTSNASARKLSKSDKHVMQLTLGLGVIRRQTTLEGLPAPTQKRKRGDEEAEKVEADFVEDNRRAKKVLTNTDRNARRLSSPVAGPSSGLVDLRSVRHRQEHAVSQQPQDRRLHQSLGPRPAQLLTPDRATLRGASSTRSTAGDRIAFATLSRPPSALRNKPDFEAQTHLSNSSAPGTSLRRSMIQATQSHGVTPPKRKKSHRVGVVDTFHRSNTRRVRPVGRCISPSSEDEVEALLHPSRIDFSPPPSLIPLGGWIGFFLHWIQ